MALSNLGAVSGSQVAPVQSYPAGTRTVGPETIPAGVSQILVLLDLRQLASLTAVVSWLVEYSIDGGANWISVGGGGVNVAVSGWTVNGGVLTNQEGGPQRAVGSLRRIPRTDLSRQVRVTFTNNETMIVGATLAVF